ncbi:MAG TPA: hypothetical protein VGN74_05395 [Brevundimonas sp.]|jgi:hypothetical protein|uniref:hypothetical protein n=1 Tax=Brevundimonas sp. TaxID=1871086 RepID=UPI002E0EA662|nr:hypothetical protein [Brevundimonas sp.]
MTDLTELERLAKDASEGPWTALFGETRYHECDDADPWAVILTPRRHEVVTLYERYARKGEDRSDYDADAAFIAAANPATVLDLIARIRHLEAEREKDREALLFYAEQSRLARLIHSEGDAGRQAISEDGGKIARARLEDTHD